MAGCGDVSACWHKSSRSGDVNCVEVRVLEDNVQVRNSKEKPGAFLTFTHDEWYAFLSGVRLGEFDLPTG